MIGIEKKFLYYLLSIRCFNTFLQSHEICSSFLSIASYLFSLFICSWFHFLLSLLNCMSKLFKISYCFFLPARLVILLIIYLFMLCARLEWVLKRQYILTTVAHCASDSFNWHQSRYTLLGLITSVLFLYFPILYVYLFHSLISSSAKGVICTHSQLNGICYTH